MATTSISVQTEDFDIGYEYQQLREQAGDCGAIVTFTGLVREIYDAQAEGTAEKIQTLTLEHYPGMTEKSLAEIAAQAEAQWPLLAIRIVHRVGELHPNSQIVLVATASSHRQAAFDGAQFMMDYLKSKAPFWKKQHSSSGTNWVQSRESDADAIKRWD